MEQFVVKVRHYRGGDSVLYSPVAKEQAETVRDELNARYQTDNHYIEPYDSKKVIGFAVGHL